MIDDEELADLAEHLVAILRRPYRWVSRDDLYAIALDAAWVAIRQHDPKGGASRLTYARRVCQFKLTTHRKRVSKHWNVEHPDGWGEDEAGNSALENLVVQPERIPAVDLADREHFWRRIKLALTPRQFEVIELCYRKGLNSFEIARRLGVPSSNVRMMRATARRKLQRTLEAFAN